MHVETHRAAPFTRIRLFCFLLSAAIASLMYTGAMAQGWSEVSPLPKPPVVATGTYTPSNAGPYFRGWTKPVYDDADQGLLFYFANPDCCEGTFSNAIFLYHVSTNSWILLWSHMTTAENFPDALDAPADNHPYHAMAWDSTRGVMWKAFGGATIGGTNGNCGDCGVSDTYRFDTANKQGVWSQICGNVTTACSPGPLPETTLAYDPIHDTLVLYGGLSGGTPTANTWEFTPRNNTWKHICGLNSPLLPTCGPPPLDAPGLVYDATLGQFVLFGGVAGSGSPMNTTTWLYSVATHSWTQANTSANPPGSKFPVMDYVPRLGAVVLIGSEPTAAHTWAFNGAQWIDLNVTGGPALSTTVKNNQGAYDASADRFVLILPGATDAGDVWALDLPSSLNVPPPLPGPAATLSQASVSFTGQAVGTVSSAQRLAITSTGTAALTFSGITITGPNGGDFAQTNTCPTSSSGLAVGSSCTVSFTFKPSTAGTENALANISDNATTGSPQAVALQGIGVASGPAVSLSPSALAFGSQIKGTSSAPQSLAVKNTGNAALTINGITITGTNSADFAQTNTCPASPSTLAAGGSCTITVTFTPSTTASESAAVSVSSNAAGSPQVVALQGTGVASGPAVSLSPSALAFGSQIKGTSSAPQSLAVKNTGNAALTINGITITGTNSADFAQTNTCPASPSTLAAGGSCTITVTFTPSTTASESAAVSVSSNAASSPQNASLNGSGVGSATFSLSASPSNATVGAGRSAAYTVTITPSGGSFNNAVLLSCSNLPAMASCSFSSDTVTPGANPVSSTLTITTTASSALYFPEGGPAERWPSGTSWLTLGTLALLSLWFLLWRGNRGRLIEGFAIVVIVCLVALQSGCAGVSGTASRPGTPTGTYTNITVTATSGSKQASATLTLTVH